MWRRSRYDRLGFIRDDNVLLYPHAQATQVTNDIFVIAHIAQRLRKKLRKDYGHDIVNSGHFDEEILTLAVYDFEHPPQHVSMETRWKHEF